MPVHDELVEVGGTRIGPAFNQGELRTSGTTEIEGANISNGYCAGVALDWARRVLLREPGPDESYMSYSKAGYGTAGTTGNLESRQRSTVRRMAKAYNEQAPHYVAKTYKEELLLRLHALRQQPQVEYDDRTGVPVPQETARMFRHYWVTTGWPFTNFEFDDDPSGVLLHTTIDQLRQNLLSRPDNQHEPFVVLGRSWANFAATVDERFREIRFAEGRTASKKGFSRLKVVRSSEPKTFDGGGNWLHVLMNRGFSINCCTVIFFQPTAGGTGHVVAVHQTAADAFVFFDPNYGAYRYARQGLQYCLQHLFWAPCVHAAEGVIDGGRAVYLRRKSIHEPAVGSWDSVAYTVLQRA
ncbi:hypothetical protein [Paraburkholderia flagellata]|uniref:hypothetical protein n=1 Tax=Paraburkholderia flagellata TaxID=2883241 RepID=UPI001F162FDC|nr:hypothetical protein [Paraburkholderia flagellata]